MAGPAASTVRRSCVVAAALAGFCLLAGCQTYESMKYRVQNLRLSSSYEDPEAQTKLAEAEELFQAGEYAKAQEVFKVLADNKGNHRDLAERARFMQAESRRLRGQYPEAVDTYHRLLMDFPTGPHRREACEKMFEIADYWLDDFRDEIAARANKGEKGILHWRPTWPDPFDRTKPPFVQEDRALEALEHVNTHDMQGPTADTALFWCGYVNFVRGNFDEADHFFSQLVEFHKDSQWRPQALLYAIQAKNNATGGAVYDGRKCAEALHLVHVAKATMPEIMNNPAMREKLERAEFAIRYQQAEKDFRTGEYYERIGRPGSAAFNYELVRRRYAGTQYADLATERKEWLMKEMAEGRKPPGLDPFAQLQAKWNEMFGPEEGEDATDPRRKASGPGTPDPRVMPAGGTSTSPAYSQTP